MIALELIGIVSVSYAAIVFMKQNVMLFSANLDIYFVIVNSLKAVSLPYVMIELDKPTL